MDIAWLLYFQIRESQAPLNIPTPTPAPDHSLGGHNELNGTSVEWAWGKRTIIPIILSRPLMATTHMMFALLSQISLWFRALFSCCANRTVRHSLAAAGEALNIAMILICARGCRGTGIHHRYESFFLRNWMIHRTHKQQLTTWGPQTSMQVKHLIPGACGRALRDVCGPPSKTSNCWWPQAEVRWKENPWKN